MGRERENSSKEWSAIKAAQGGVFTPEQRATLFGDAGLQERKRQVWLAEQAAKQGRNPKQH